MSAPFNRWKLRSPQRKAKQKNHQVTVMQAIMYVRFNVVSFSVQMMIAVLPSLRRRKKLVCWGRERRPLLQPHPPRNHDRKRLRMVLERVSSVTD